MVGSDLLQGGAAARGKNVEGPAREVSALLAPVNRRLLRLISDMRAVPYTITSGTMWPTGRRVAAGTVQRLRPVAVRPRRGGILVNIVLTRELDSARVHRAERVSAIRWQNEVILKDPLEVDAELLAWIREGYAHSA